MCRETLPLDIVSLDTFTDLGSDASKGDPYLHGSPIIAVLNRRLMGFSHLLLARVMQKLLGISSCFVHQTCVQWYPQAGLHLQSICNLCAAKAGKNPSFGECYSMSQDLKFPTSFLDSSNSCNSMQFPTCSDNLSGFAEALLQHSFDIHNGFPLFPGPSARSMAEAMASIAREHWRRAPPPSTVVLVLPFQGESQSNCWGVPTWFVGKSWCLMSISDENDCSITSGYVIRILLPRSVLGDLYFYVSILPNNSGSSASRNGTRCHVSLKIV